MIGILIVLIKVGISKLNGEILILVCVLRRFLEVVNKIIIRISFCMINIFFDEDDRIKIYREG